ncbi:MAG: hypothetical protein ACHQWU_08860, partial [Gemmatimonadales bacterium]
MAAAGDGDVAGLLSALAEAPDFEAATSYLLTQLVEIAAAPRSCLFQIDSAHEVLTLVASAGFDGRQPSATLPLGDLSTPIVVGALALFTLRGEQPVIGGPLAALAPWILIPLVKPRERAARDRMPRHRALDILASLGVDLVTVEARIVVASIDTYLK